MPSSDSDVRVLTAAGLSLKRFHFLFRRYEKKVCSRDSPTSIMSNDATNNALLQSGVNHIPALILSLLIGPR
jgi:hypothetical protein